MTVINIGNCVIYMNTCTFTEWSIQWYGYISPVCDVMMCQVKVHILSEISLCP